jgi:quercetin dioxygenase-like cupin family protein
MGVKGKLQNQKERDHLNNNPSLQKNHNFIPKKGTTMNPLIQFKKIPILPLVIALALAVVAPALATPVCGVNTEILALGHYPSGSLDLMCNEFDLYGWNLKLKVKGDSDVYVTRHTFPVGAHTGWHTHPGPSLITVIAGELTVYETDSPNCTPIVYHTGESFTDIGCGDVHLVGNEGTVPAMDVAVQIVPAGAPRRIDADQPASCPVITCP